MKYFFLVILSFAFRAQATTAPIFGPDKATVFVNGMTDDDAHDLYEAMATPPQDINGKLSKHFNFDSADGTRTFSLTCVQSKVMANSATCTLIIYMTQLTSVDKAAGIARYDLIGGEAQRLAANFYMPDGVFTRERSVYQSRDQRLNISVQMSQNGVRIDRMSVTYQ
jgi:hypothetical protein